VKEGDYLTVRHNKLRTSIQQITLLIKGVIQVSNLFYWTNFSYYWL